MVRPPRGQTSPKNHFSQVMALLINLVCLFRDMVGILNDQAGNLARSLLRILCFTKRICYGPHSCCISPPFPLPAAASPSLTPKPFPLEMPAWVPGPPWAVLTPEAFLSSEHLHLFPPTLSWHLSHLCVLSSFIAFR